LPHFATTAGCCDIASAARNHRKSGPPTQRAGVVRQVRGLLRLPAKNNTTSGPPAYVNRDFNAACNILRAGILPQRPAHLCAGQPKVDREIKSLLRPRRPQPTGAVQEAAGMAGEGPEGEEVG
jgi:hypothetical protein